MKNIRRGICILSVLILMLCQAPRCFAAVHQHDWHYYWDRGLYAECDSCGACASVTLNTDEEFSYCPGTTPLYTTWVTETDWDMEENTTPSGYYNTDILESYFFVYEDINESGNAWQIGVPSQPGTYKVAIALDPNVSVEDRSGDYGAYQTYATVHIGHRSSEIWTADGQSLCVKCKDCQQPIAKLTLSDEAVKGVCVEETVTPNVTTWFADEETESLVELPSYSVIYQGKKGTSYAASAVQPTEQGNYTMRLALLAEGEKYSKTTVQSATCDLTVKAHNWTYWTNEYSIYAQCSGCGESAEVCLDTSTVYDASRNYNGLTLDYEVFYEKNWSSQEDIEPYNILFSGTETISETSTTLYDHAFVKPQTTGNYTVSIALLSDQDDPDTAWLQTKQKVYYLADISVGQCDVLTYGATQIAQFTEPELVDGYYQVGTLSELLWCMTKHNSDANISLTNDIVVNPITVNEDGEIRSASYQIYKWIGFGTEKKPYTGNILGNGYTIYGIYQPDSSIHYNGFVNNGKNCQISNLTVENSVIYGTDAAAIAGHYDHTSSNDDKISDCHSLNCYINGTGTCGGIVSWLTSTASGSLQLYGCSSSSILCGEAARGAGGIVGRAKGVDVLYLQCCSNLGPITSEKGMAGGIVGYADMDTSDSCLVIWDCFNTGTITCPNYVGGIAGYLKDYNNEGFFFDNCTSIGYLSAAKNVGGIAGYISTTGIWDRRQPTQGNYYYNAKTAFVTANASVNLEDHAEKLTKSQVNGNFVCSRYQHTPCSHWTAVSSANCTQDGELQLKCAICDAVMESETIRAYGHRYEYGECVCCGAYEEDEEDDLAGSVFGNTSLVIIIAASGALILLMSAWLIIKRIKKNK